MHRGPLLDFSKARGFSERCQFGYHITSQISHNGLIRLVIDSLAFIGVASILGLVLNRRTFFAAYILGGFLAAAAVCAWAWLTNQCRSLPPAQLDQVLTSVRMSNEAIAKQVKLITSSEGSIMKRIVESLKNEEIRRQNKVIITYQSQVRDWDIWTRPNQAANGSLICLRMPTTRRGVRSISLICIQSPLNY